MKKSKTEYRTTDISLVAYLCLRGYKIKEIKNVGTNIVLYEFVVNCDKKEAKKYQDEFLTSEFRTYYKAIEDIKYLMRNYRERERA